jgi:hypothetical protein
MGEIIEEMIVENLSGTRRDELWSKEVVIGSIIGKCAYIIEVECVVFSKRESILILQIRNSKEVDVF